MNSPFKVDFATRQKKRPNARPRRWDYRAHYADLARRTLSSIVKHRTFIFKCLAVAFVLGCIAIPLMPRKYSAEALIYPNLLASDQDKAVAKASIDGATMVTGEARAIRLGNDPKPGSSRSWLRLPIDWFRAAWLPETLNYSSFDRAVALLRN